MDTLQKRYEHDRTIWEDCASIYERQIVRGHPDVTGYEAFEHSFIDRLAIHLTRDCGQDLYCYDFGCGSGRIHRVLAPMLFPAEDKGEQTQIGTGGWGKIVHVGGVDFSEQMIQLAHRNLIDAGLQQFYPDYLSFDIGSAFDVIPYKGNATPLAVSVCNSIGVMQGPEGAQKLFSVMRNFVQPRNGIALISCYRREAVKDFALGNYESTMDVCGQPVWLTPPTWAEDHGNTLVPHYYKRAYCRDDKVVVDIYGADNKLLKKNVTLTRDPEEVHRVIATGMIDTFDGYHSLWYSTDQIKLWMKEYWSDGTLWHIPGGSLDRLRGEPAQLAIVDFNGAFSSLASKWGYTPFN